MTTGSRRWFAAFVVLVILLGVGLVAQARLVLLATSPARPTRAAASGASPGDGGLGGGPTPDATLPPPVQAGDLAALFRAPPNAPFTTSAGPAVLSVLAAEPIQLPSGRLVAADVFFLDEPLVFTGALAAGETKVTLLLARYGADDLRTAAVIIGDPARTQATGVRWDPAPVDGQPVPTVDAMPAFAVDFGTAGFTSVEGSARIKDDQGMGDRILEALQASDFTTPVHLALDDARTLDLLAVPSGWGDGRYVTWRGTDPGGTVVGYLTSFDVLDTP